MLRKITALLLCCALCLAYALPALAADAPAVLHADGFDLEFVRAKYERASLSMQLNIIHDTREDISKYLLTTAYFDTPWYVHVQMHLLTLDGAPLIDWDDVRFDIWTDPETQRPDGRWSVPLQFSIRGFAMADSAFMLALSSYNGFTGESTPLDLENVMIIPLQ